MEYYKLKTIAFYIFVGTIMFVNLKGSENENEWSCSCCNCLKKEKKYKNSVGKKKENNAVKNESVGENLDGQSIIVKKNEREVENVDERSEKVEEYNKENEKRIKVEINNLVNKEVNNVVNNVVNINTTNEENKNRKYSSKFIGLQNCYQSCYINSILQVLVHTPDFIDYFLQNDFNKEEQPLSYALKNFCKQYFEARNDTAFNPKELYIAIGEKFKEEAEYRQFGNGQPHDAANFLYDILGELGKENENYKNIFLIKEKTLFMCNISMHKEESESKSLWLSCGLPNNYLEQKKLTSYNISLENILKNNSLKRKNKKLCKKCKPPIPGIIKHEIVFLQKYLIAYLDTRITYYDKDRGENVYKKIKDFIEIPKELNLKKYYGGRQDDINFNYTLYGKVQHSGIHYYAAIKNRENWYECNDSCVSPIKKPFSDDGICSKDLAPGGTCLLFYKMKENESILPEK